ncbi:hypothetical protein DZS_14030 [Dickeya ananatis]
MLLQHPQVKLHQIPADNHIRIVGVQPLIEFFQQLWTAGDVFQRQVASILSVAIFWPQHKYLTLAAPFQTDAVKLAVAAGFDIQRHGFE